MHAFALRSSSLLLAAALAACGSSSGGGTDASASDSKSVESAAGGGKPFPCGTLTCHSAQQYCFIVAGHLPGMAATYVCMPSDGGPPSCGGSNSTTKAGGCGCYESASGEVTIAECPP